MTTEHKITYQLSSDYKQLFNRVMGGEVIAAFVDFTSFGVEKVYRDLCKVVLNRDTIEGTARGICYLSVSEFDLLLCKGEYSLQEIFVRDCEKLNLGWVEPEQTTSAAHNSSNLRSVVEAMLEGNSLTANDRVKLMEALK